MKLKTHALSILACFFVFSAQGTHTSGATISYKALDTFKFEVTYELLRDCRGVPMVNPSNESSVRCVTGGTAAMSLTLISIEEITPLAVGISGACKPANTYGTGEGIEKHIYRDTIDFNDTAYSSLKNCGRILFTLGVCCRNGAINTGPSGNFFTYAELNLDRANENSSPIFTNQWPAIQCCNQPVFATFGAVDTTDHDSLSYSWGNALTGWNQSVLYSSNYAYNHPFQTYYPGTLKPPYSNCSASPPIGICFDSETGQVIYTPTRCDEVTVAVVEVTEWRKDTSGVYQKIGLIRYDKQFITKQCPDNNPPEVDGPYSYSVCAGSQLCFNVTTDDAVFVPAPPAPTPSPDTVTIQWNQAIPDASFNVINASARLQTGRFCWTPTDEDASSVPYQFVVQARDNARPLNSISSRVFRVKVKSRAQSEVQLNNLGCGLYTVNSNVSSDFVGSASYRWQVLDTALVPVVNANTAAFNSRGDFLSLSKSDTLTINRPGTYIVQHTINNSPLNCPTTYYDTIVHDYSFYGTLNVTDTTHCVGESLLVVGSSLGGTYPHNRVWLKNGDTLNQSNYYFSASSPAAGLTDDYTLIATSSDGCISKQSFSFSSFPNEFPSFTDSIKLCPDTVTLDLGSSFPEIYWKNGSSDSIIYVPEAGEQWVYLKDQYGCTDTLRTHIYHYPVPAASVGDPLLCDTAVQLYAGPWEGVLWSDGNTGQYNTFVNSGSFQVAVTNNYGCQTIKSFEVQLTSPHVFDLPQKISECCSEKKIVLDSFLAAQDPRNGNWSHWEKPQAVVNGQLIVSELCEAVESSTYVTYVHHNPATKCVSSDSIQVVVSPLPRTELAAKSYCQDEEEIDLDVELVLLPTSAALGTPAWRCLDCNGQDFSSMLVDKGFPGLPKWWLQFDSTVYTIQSEQADTLLLEYSYTSAFGCEQLDTVELVIGKASKPPLIDRTHKTIHSDQTADWYRNDTLIAQALDSIQIGISGNYKAVVVNPYCGDQLSNTLEVMLSVPDLKALGLEVFPNPSNGTVYLKSTSGQAIHELAVKLFDTSGKRVQLNRRDAGNTAGLSWDGAAGIYLLEIQSPQGTAQIRLFKTSH